jgi:hypothetical protein
MFQLSILIGRDKGWLFVSDRDAGVAGAVHERMLTDIGRSLGCGALEFHSLNWPVFALPSLPYQSSAVLIEWVRELICLQPGGILICFGRGLPSQLLLELGAARRVLLSDFAVGEAVRSPSEKRRLWRFLLRLCFQGT